MRQINILASASLAVALLVAAPAIAPAMGPSSPPTSSKGANYTQGERAVQEKDYAKAIPLLERALTDNPRDADANNLLGYSHRKLGHTDAALSYYTRALQLDPNNKGANEYLGELYVELKDLPKAQDRLQKLSQICGTSCEEYRDLQAAIQKAQAAGPKTGT